MVKCDKCGYTAPLPSREGMVCNNTTGGGYCQGKLRKLGDLEEETHDDPPPATKPTTKVTPKTIIK